METIIDVRGVILLGCAYFFMLTGATLFGYRNKYSTQVFFKREFLEQ